VKLLCTNGLKAVAVELIPQTDLTVEPVYSSTNLLLEKIGAGESGDLAILSAEAIDDLIGRGVLAGGSRVDIVKSSIGVAVRQGELAPDITSVEALKAALLAAKAVAYSRTGISGLYMPKLFDTLGIAEEEARERAPS
jgi:molybdate transport system substrate-binding protein